MKIINLNSRYELSPAQVHYAYSVALNGNDSHHSIANNDIVRLMDEIPIYLLQPDNMPDLVRLEGEKPSTEWLGFYQHQSSIHGVYTPSIGLCPERIAECVETEWELMVLIAKVIIHEFAHAQMRLESRLNYSPIDEFYEWMEEPGANLITLHHFKNSSRGYHGRNKKQIAHVETDLKPLDYVQDFISRQPNNYRLGLDLYKHKIQFWRWALQKNEIQKRTNEKNAWLEYVKANVGKTDPVILERLLDDLCK